MRLEVIVYRRFGTTYRSHLQRSGIQKDVTLDKTFYNLLFKNEVAAAPVTLTFFLITFLDEASIINIIIKPL